MNSHDTAELPAVEVSQSPVDKFREYLDSRPRTHRFTEQQREMIEFIFSHHNHFDAEQLSDDLKRAGLRVSRATVFRTLHKLVDAGLLREIGVGQQKVYEHDYGYPKHDHFHCEKCKRIIEFQDPLVESIIQKVSHEHGFQVKGHSFVVHGLCASCNKARTIKRRLDLV